MIPLKIETLLEGRVVEHDRVEYKTGWNPNDIIHSICAFANDYDNSNGGYIVIGVKEENGMPVFPLAGVQKEELDSIQQEIFQYCNMIVPRYIPRMEIVNYKNSETYLIYLWCPAGDSGPYQAPQSVYSVKGGKIDKSLKYWIRPASLTTDAKQDEISELYDKFNSVPFDDRINRKARIDDIRRGYIEDFIRKSNSSLINELNNCTLEDLLIAQEVADETDTELDIRNIGVLMFTEHPEKLIPGAYIELIRFNTKDAEASDDFIEKIRAAVKSHGDDKLLLGEVWEDATTKEAFGQRRTYLRGRGLDAVMNYPFGNAALDYLHGGDVAAVADALMQICENYPAPALDCAMNFLSTHDTERALTVIADEPANGRGREWQSGRCVTGEAYEEGMLRLRMAYAIIYTLPGVPCLYYGDEIGMQGYRDPFNRRCYPWGNENLDLIEFTRQLGVIRKGTHAFEQGHMMFIEVDDNVCVFARYDKITREAAIIYLNKSTRGHTFEIVNDKTDMFYDFVPAFDRYGRGIKDGKVQVAPFDYAVIYCKV